MYGCIQSSLFTMTADLYEQLTEQEETTNAIVRRWILSKNIQCSVIPIKETGSSISSDNKNFGKDYVEELEIKLRTTEKLSKRWRVSGIKNNQKKELYLEIDKVSSPDTIFEVVSSHPTFDIFGNIQYYESHLKRTQVQLNG